MKRSLRPCRTCKELTRNRQGYCEVCAQTHHHDTWKAHQRGRSAAERGYGSAWRTLRETILRRDHYLCQLCRSRGKNTVANIVDHVRPKSRGGTDDPANLQSLCKPCHDHKTATERR